MGLDYVSASVFPSFDPAGQMDLFLFFAGKHANQEVRTHEETQEQLFRLIKMCKVVVWQLDVTAASLEVLQALKKADLLWPSR